MGSEAASRVEEQADSHHIAPLWLDRFEQPTPIRRRGRIHVYSCRDANSLAPKVVLVGAPDAPADVVAETLDAIAVAHERVKGPAIPALDERGRAGLIDFVSLDSAGCIDMEHFARYLARSGERVPHPAGMVLADLLMDSIEAAHCTTDPRTGTGYVFGAFCFANVLLGPGGQASLLGIGANFPVQPEPGAFVVSPGTAQPPEMLAGEEPTPSADVWAFYSLWRNLAPFAQISKSIADGLRGRGGAMPGLGEMMIELDRAALHPSPEARLPDISGLRAAFHGVRRIHTTEPDPKTWGTFVDHVIDVVTGGGTSRPEMEQAVFVPMDSRQYWQGGRYRVDHPIDSGASGTVFLGHDRQLDVPVAMKMISGRTDSVARKRFYREVRLLRSVNHAHLVRGFDLFEEGGTLVAVMELLRGERLDHVARRAPMALDAVRGYIGDVADALSSLHAMGVVHRDVKPANTMVTEDRGAVLVDFGVAVETSSMGELTAGGTIGTPAYMPPEQLRGEALDGSADVYALGMTWLRVISGTPVATAEGDPVPADPGALDRLPDADRDLAHRMLSESPGDRPSAAEVVAAIRGRAPDVPARPEGPTLQVHDGGRRVVLPSGEIVNLSRRRAPRLIFWRLVEQHRDDPGSALTWEDLQEAGWPGERMSFDSGRSRVYVAVYTLRKMGFDAVLSRQDDGYLLNPELVLDLGD